MLEREDEPEAGLDGREVAPRFDEGAGGHVARHDPCQTSPRVPATPDPGNPSVIEALARLACGQVDRCERRRSFESHVLGVALDRPSPRTPPRPQVGGQSERWSRR